MSRRSLLWTHFLLSLLVLYRTLPFLFFGAEVMDADEGLFGLMAKQLSEGRAFPIYGYGTRYNLAINSWLSAPLMHVFGASVVTLKLPLVLLNLLVVNLTAYFSMRGTRAEVSGEGGAEARFGEWRILICCLWLALPSFSASRGLMDACIGGIEPFFFILMVWALRDRPLWGGLLSGLALAQRPYVLYGVVSVLFLKAFSEKVTLKKLLVQVLLWSSGIVFSNGLIRYLAKHFSSNYFGVTSPLALKKLRFVLEDLRGFFAETLPQTIGLQIQHFHPPVFIARNELAQSSHFDTWGLAFTGLGAGLLVILLRWSWRRGRDLWKIDLAREDLRFPFFLLGVGACSFIAYILASPPSPDLRFTLLVLFGMTGVYALFYAFQGRPRKARPIDLAVLAFALGCLANNLVSVGQGWKDLIALDRVHPTRNLIQYLKAHQIQATRGGFFAAYNLAFLSNEEFTVTDGGLTDSRIPENARIFLNTAPEHRALVDYGSCGSDAVRVEHWFVCLRKLEAEAKGVSKKGKT